ncbi:MAG: hypothetical protein ACOVLC_11245 [Flavobacterium sp.]
MFKEILNSEGVEQLSRQQMKGVDGGKSLDSGLDTRCRVLLGNGQGGIINFTGATTPAQVSAAANAWCVNAVINSGAGSCRYDCYHDGQG